MNKFNQLIHKRIFKVLSVLQVAGILLGGLLGYAYYYFIGCANGTCAITSNPWLSVLWGVALGYLIADLFHTKEKQSVEK